MAATHLGNRKGRLAIAVGFLVATTYDLLFVGASQTVAVIQWLGAGVAALLCATLAIRFCAYQNQEIAPQPPTSRKPALLSWGICCGFACILMLIQGFCAQVTGYGGAGAGARFGLSGDIVSLVTRVLIVIYCLTTDHGPRPAVLSTALAAVWAVALTAITLSWGAANELGELLLEAGYNILQVAVLLMAFDAATRTSLPRLPLFCTALAALFANQITRLIGVLAISTPQADLHLMTATTCISLTVLVLAEGVALLVAHRRAAVVASVPPIAQQAPVPPTNQEAMGGFAQRELDFCRRFEQVCSMRGLTEREREVLFVAVHGYTIDGIAEQLTISRETVKSNLSRAYSRAGVNGKQGLLALMDSLPAASPGKDA